MISAFTVLIRWQLLHSTSEAESFFGNLVLAELLGSHGFSVVQIERLSYFKYRR
jgi:hypothetical protein